MGTEKQNKTILFIIPIFLITIFIGVIVLSTGKNNPIDLSLADNQETQEIPTAVEEHGYLAYSPEKFEEAVDKKRVYFFHATWCPTCKAANKNFLQNSGEIPDNVVVFKTDYDTYTDLKKKYNITYQYTFVQVDEQGEEITKWSGGDIEELLANLQ